jgi:hypothetical protein
VRSHRWRASLLVGLIVGVLVLTPLAAGRAEPPGGDVRNPEDFRPQGSGFCFERTLVLGGLVITGGRCFTFYLVRTDAGSFLGFGPPGPPIVTPGQIIRLGTPAGAQIRSRMLHLVHLPAAVTTLPVNAVQFVAVRVGVGGERRLIFTIPNGERSLEVGFAQR